MNTNRTEYHCYLITLETSQEYNDLLNFHRNNPSLDITNKFDPLLPEYLYPKQYEVIVPANSPQETAILLCFPQARLRTIFNCATVALG